MKSAPVLRLWMNSRVGKSIARSVIARSAAWPAIMPSRPTARASSRAIAARAAASGAARPALGQDLVGAVQQREGRQDRGRLAVGHVAGRPPAPRGGVVHAGQVVEDQARGVHHLDGAGGGQDASRDRRAAPRPPAGRGSGRRRFAGANRLSATAACTAGGLSPDGASSRRRLDHHAAPLERRFEQREVGAVTRRRASERLERLEDLLVVAVHPDPAGRPCARPRRRR